jgi:hypothetical protein
MPLCVKLPAWDWRIWYCKPVTEVIGTDEFSAWFFSLDDLDTKSIVRIVELLETRGTTLEFPYSSSILGTNIALRELRVRSQGKSLRIFYIFDPLRQAVLLIGGTKNNSKRFYTTFIPQAEQLWFEYLRETGL